jgi:hypothetical protein
LRIQHVEDAVTRGGPGFRNLIAQNKYLQEEALGVARAEQEKVAETERAMKQGLQEDRNLMPRFQP